MAVENILDMKSTALAGNEDLTKKLEEAKKNKEIADNIMRKQMEAASPILNIDYPTTEIDEELSKKVEEAIKKKELEDNTKQKQTEVVDHALNAEGKVQRKETEAQSKQEIADNTMERKLEESKYNRENYYASGPQKQYEEKNYSNIGYVEIRYLEMRREISRINEKTEELISSLNALIEGINALAALVDAKQIEGRNIILTLKGNATRINDFASSQIDKYEELNDEINNRILTLANELTSSAVESNGAVKVLVYDDNNKPVEKTHQQLLKELEEKHNKELSATALINSSKEGYRVFDGDKYIADALNVSEDRWENFETMYAYFSEKGLTDEQISGIMANAAGESGFDKNAKNPNSTAQGFFQWLDFRQPENWEVQTQLDHAWNELENGLNWGGVSTLSRMQNCTTPEQASDTFLQYFEGGGSPANGPFKGLYPKRETFARDIYNYIQKMKG